MTGAMPWPRAVVFDVDDTLYLERDYVRSGFRAVDAHLREHHGAAGFFERAWAAFEQGVRGRTFDEVLPQLGLSPARELIAELVEVYRTHPPQIDLLPDARAALEAARRAGWAVAVVTDGPLASQSAKVEALGLSRWAEPVVLTAALGEGFGKPHPRAFRLVEEGTGCREEQCVYLADNPGKDFAGPKRLGWRTVRVRRPGGLHAEEPSGQDVDEVWEDLLPLVARADELAEGAGGRTAWR